MNGFKTELAEETAKLGEVEREVTSLEKSLELHDGKVKKAEEVQ